MSTADCDIGLLEAFLCEEDDGSVPCLSSPFEAEEQNGSAALDASTNKQPSNTETATYVTNVSANTVESTPKVASAADKQAKKRQFSREFMKGRESHLMHKGETDSSDDEDNKYFEEQNYSDYGRTVKHLLNKTVDTVTEGAKWQENLGEKWKRRQSLVDTNLGQVKTDVKPSRTIAEIDEDPVFGIRIIKPLISSMSLKERVVGRQVIQLANLKRHLLRDDHSSDWVIGGVVISKSGARTSQKGAEYAIWRISDLKAGLKTASIFLFGKCFKEHWKTSVGAVIGVLNPKPLDNRDGNGDEAVLSVDNPQKVMIMGTSKDFGMCKARKKNGDNCTSFVNMNVCEFCVYHLQKAYKSCSRRTQLQSPCAGRGLDKLRNKVLGKNEVFYAGHSYLAVPAKKSRKQVSKDNERLKKLSDFYKPDASIERSNKENNSRPKYISTLLDANRDQVRKDQERLRKLCGTTPLQSSSVNADVNVKTAVAEKTQTKLVVEKINAATSSSPTASLALDVPQLGRGIGDLGTVDLTPPRVVHRERAKLNALKWIQKHGPIRKEDPNQVPGTEKNKTKGKREVEADTNAAAKQVKLETGRASSLLGAAKEAASPAASTGVNSRFQQLLKATSRHMELIEARDNEAQEEYFDKLEKKEKLEDKMLSTYKVPCKAVRCLKCKYTAFSASELCKTEGHPLKVTDGVKRFFRCYNCGNRTVCLELIPLISCKNCASSHWERAPMIREKKVGLATALSLRGDEEMYIGSLQSDGNLNLLVPE